MSQSACQYCDGTGTTHYGPVVTGLGPTRVYGIVTSDCWDCNGTGDAPEPSVFHGLDRASLDSILKETK